MTYVKPGSDQDPAIKARRDLLRTTTYVPGQGRMPNDELTAEDYEARIAFLTERGASAEVIAKIRAEIGQADEEAQA